jgi:hypothetical protein
VGRNECDTFTLIFGLLSKKAWHSAIEGESNYAAKPTHINRLLSHGSEHTRTCFPHLWTQYVTAKNGRTPAAEPLGTQNDHSPFHSKMTTSPLAPHVAGNFLLSGNAKPLHNKKWMRLCLTDKSTF